MYQWVLCTLYLKRKSLYSQVLALRIGFCQPFTNSTHKSVHSALSQIANKCNNGNNRHLKVDVYNYLLLYHTSVSLME